MITAKLRIISYSHLGVTWTIKALQVPTTPAIFDTSFQAFHKEYLCRREEPHYRQLPPAWCRFPGMYVRLFSYRSAYLTAIFTDLEAPQDHPPTIYDLIVNITHESVAGTTRDKVNTAWKAHVRAGSGGGENEKWFQIQDLIVEEVRKEMIFLGETVIQVS